MRMMRARLLSVTTLLTALFTALPCLLLASAANADTYRGNSFEQHQQRPQMPGANLVRRIFGEDKLYFRLGASFLEPNLKTRSIELKNLSNIAEVAVEPGPQEGEAYAEGILLPGAIVGYNLPWGRGWSVETIIGLPPTLEVKLKGPIADEPLVEEAQGIPTGVSPLGSDAVETKVIPPIVTLVKRFRPERDIRPYAGLGMTYLYSYDTRVTNALLTEVGHPDVDIENRFGWVAQAGIDYRLSGYWWANLDVKYVSVPKVKGTMRRTFIRAPGLPQYEFVEVGDAEFVADMEAFAVHLGIGFTF
ncbi:OmpW/AlkL family protein [Alcanivorax limicola]|uniref:OmpW/AlkL family protein n=1 Tax=Alcanivorax limicola TaxID=2874102 RepID=UPI001CBBE99C|nr:OmpW family outer membrane protein [Alcanivorax limicola]